MGFSTSDQDLDLTGLKCCEGSIDVQTLILYEQSISRRIFDGFYKSRARKRGAPPRGHSTSVLRAYFIHMNVFAV